MAKSTVTVVLSGEILLSDFAAGVERFSELMDALTKEVAQGARIDWKVEDLAPGSALTTVRGVPWNAEDQPRVEAVVEAYGRVGEALTAGRPVPYPESVVRAAGALIAVINERVEAIRLETEDQDWTVTSAEPQSGPPPVEQVEAAFGAIEGRVQTLSSRGGLRFTLYDTLHDRAVSCYLAEGYEDIMRDSWGRLAVVQGLVKRDPRTGRPVTVRQVRSVELLGERSPGDYKRARAVIPLSGNAPRAEDVIRQLRDA
jgi:hypothetical protein